jgi:hypothetical protein
MPSGGEDKISFNFTGDWSLKPSSPFSSCWGQFNNHKGLVPQTVQPLLILSRANVIRMPLYPHS